MPPVVTIRLGINVGPCVAPFVNAYLVRSGNGWVMVDTGPPGSARTILRAIMRHGIGGDRVHLILLTHGHFDHTGSALELQRLLPGKPRIAMHPADRPLVTGACWPRTLRPATVGGAFGYVGGAIGMGLCALGGALRPWPARALDAVIWLDEVALSDTPTDLLPLCGMEARAIRTPGHSPGSLTVVLPTGQALVGDMISRGINNSPRGAALVDDPLQVPASLKRIAGLGATTIYPGHGGPFQGADLARLAYG